MDENKKQCSKCKRYRTNDYFEDWRKLCNVCIDAKRRYREKHKEPLSRKYKVYYEEQRDDLLSKAKERREIMEFCFVCNRDIKQYDISRHSKSKKHINNMEALNKQS